MELWPMGRPTKAKLFSYSSSRESSDVHHI
jgi:hypothetical protein